MPRAYRPARRKPRRASTMLPGSVAGEVARLRAPHALPPGRHGQTAGVRPRSPVCRRSHRPAGCAAIAGHHRGPRARPCSRRPPTVPACSRGARRAGCAAASLHAAPRRALHALWRAPIVDRSPKLPAGWSSPFRPIAQLRVSAARPSKLVLRHDEYAACALSIASLTSKTKVFMRSRTESLEPANMDGGEEEDRTPDLCIANAALSQLSYFP